jgi:hypothetical protein
MDQGILLPPCHERPCAPPVFGWAGALARPTEEIAAVGLWCEEGFDTQLGLPVVPQVIVGAATRTQPETKVCEAHLVRMVTAADAPQPGSPLLCPVDAALVTVGIRPAHGELQAMMPIGDGMVTADEQTPPDHRTDAESDNGELGDGRFCGVSHGGIFPDLPPELPHFFPVSEYAIAPSVLIFRPPVGMSTTDAASLPCVFFTAWYAFQLAELKRGDTALIHAAGSGVGMAGIQIAKALGA